MFPPDGGAIASEFTLVSWNVNSLRVRLAQVLRYLEARRPDVLCLQETRLGEDAFPTFAFEERGYHVATTASAGYAGVAIVSREPVSERVSGVAGFQESRPAGRRLLCRIGPRWIDTVYVPTRKSIGKLPFLDALAADHAVRFAAQEPVVLCGDFNICFDERDLASPSMIQDAALHPRRPEDLAFRRLVEGRLVDCLRTVTAEGGLFTWYPLTSWALRRNYGMRLDYVFATPALASRVVDASHDREPRGWERPSDHLPVRIRFDASVPG